MDKTVQIGNRISAIAGKHAGKEGIVRKVAKGLTEKTIGSVWVKFDGETSNYFIPKEEYDLI